MAYLKNNKTKSKWLSSLIHADNGEYSNAVLAFGIYKFCEIINVCIAAISYGIVEH